MEGKDEKGRRKEEEESEAVDEMNNNRRNTNRMEQSKNRKTNRNNQKTKKKMLAMTKSSGWSITRVRSAKSARTARCEAPFLDKTTVNIHLTYS